MGGVTEQRGQWEHPLQSVVRKHRLRPPADALAFSAIHGTDADEHLRCLGRAGFRDVALASIHARSIASRHLQMARVDGCQGCFDSAAHPLEEHGDISMHQLIGRAGQIFEPRTLDYHWLRIKSSTEDPTGLGAVTGNVISGTGYAGGYLAPPVPHRPGRARACICYSVPGSVVV